MTLERLRALLEDERTTNPACRPLVFTLESGLRPLLDDLCERYHVTVDDHIVAQVREWRACRMPSERSLGRDEADDVARAELAQLSGDPSAYGSWVYYPWRRQLLHILPDEAFQEVRRNRNRNKITAREDRRLRAARVGVVGLSVGHAAAVLLAREGIGRELRLADFDHLELSNLNRVATSLTHLYLAKSEIASRDIAEIDPYLSVRVFTEGITEANIDEFLTGDGQLDIVIEECDTLWIKLLVRERARHLGIPVVMDTNDRGMLDIERFDLEPERPILHGYVGKCDAEKARAMEAGQRAGLFYSILGGAESLSSRLRESLPMVGEQLVGVPQLASDVYLGAALAVDATRKILLGAPLLSGRYYVDLDQLVGR